MAPTRIERLAAWAAELSPADVPAEIRELALAQRLSVHAAIAAAAGDQRGRQVLRGVMSWAAPGPAPLPASTESVRVEDAAYAAAALSVAQDFDDYVCFGHTGHSAVVVTDALAAETGAGDDDRLSAQVAASEIAARLGGACLIGPLNGQMWSFIHAAAAAAAAGRLLGLDAGRLGHAIAISLYQAPRPVAPGFFEPDTKMLTASEPATAGVRAARLALEGVTGPLDALDHPQGFLAAFSYAALPRLLGNLGTGWTLKTLCVKPYPGCAYVDTTLDALGQIGPIDPGDVDRVSVDAGLLTVAMDAASRPYATAGTLSPITVAFSIPLTVAVALEGGRVSPHVLTDQWLREHAGRIRDLASRVSLRHDWALTARSAEAFGPILAPALAGVSPARLVKGVRQLRASHPRTELGFAGIGSIAALVRSAPRALRSGPGGCWDPESLDGFEMTFPARVRVRLKSGRSLSAEASVPRGGAGHRTEGPVAVAAAKHAAFCPDPDPGVGPGGVGVGGV